jgi:hypothetical protein
MPDLVTYTLIVGHFVVGALAAAWALWAVLRGVRATGLNPGSFSLGLAAALLAVHQGNMGVVAMLFLLEELAPALDLVDRWADDLIEALYWENPGVVLEAVMGVLLTTAFLLLWRSRARARC